MHSTPTPRRLGYLIPEFPSQTHIFFWREILQVRALGQAVTLLSTSRPAPDACRHAFAAEARRDTHYLFPPNLPRALWRLFQRPLRAMRALRYLGSLQSAALRSWVRRLGLLLTAAALAEQCAMRRLDHLHVHSCANSAHLAALARHLGGPRYSLTLHGDLDVYGEDHALKMEGAEFIACVTRALQAQVHERLGVALARLPVLWMGVDTGFFRPAAEASARPSFALVTVARLNPSKGHQYALAAFRQFLSIDPAAHYYIVGDGPFRTDIEQQIDALDLRGSVSLLGSLAETDVMTLLQRCDVFLLPSVGLGEAAPVSVMEAMASGLAVIASTIGGTPDMIEDGCNGFLVPQGDSRAILSRLQTLRQDPALCRRLGAAARATAESKFETSALAKEFLVLLNSGAAAVPGNRDA